jgi:hypothetical protein
VEDLVALLLAAREAFVSPNAAASNRRRAGALSFSFTDLHEVRSRRARRAPAACASR